MPEPSDLAAVAAAEGALAAARAAAQALPASDWICDRGGLHDVGMPCGCTDEF